MRPSKQHAVKVYLREGKHGKNEWQGYVPDPEKWINYKIRKPKR